MQYDTADKLHIEWDHVPLDLLTGNDKARTNQATAGVLDDSKRLRKDLVEHGLRDLIALFLQFGNALGDLLALGVRNVLFQAFAKLGHFIHYLADSHLNALAEFHRLRAKLVVGEACETGVNLIDLIDKRQQILDISRPLRSE